MTCLRVDPLGNVVSTATTTQPRPGDNVVLTLDPALQSVTQQRPSQIESLQAQGDLQADSGAAVVLDPDNGDVLAMASFPTYNPSVFVGGISEANYRVLTSAASGDPLFNRALDGGYTPGSTFKLATATAALDTGLITPYTPIDDATGYFTVPGGCTSGCTFHDDDSAALGVLNVSQALTASDDVSSTPSATGSGRNG